jgi:muramoyltetrapeptide carboxypeptidase
LKFIKPKRLKKGDVIGICAPASPPESDNKLERGIRYLEKSGYRIEVGKNVNRRHGYLAGTDKERADDINRLFANKHVRAIFTVRGGYGSHRILPLINYQLLRRNPKIFLGYSDITAIHFAILSRTGLITFSGPMVAVEFADGLSGVHEERFWQMLTTDKNLSVITTNKSKRTVRKPGSARGRLLAGNLSIVTGLIGTPYFPFVSRPIYMIEEIDERPYKIDRMFQNMKLAGLLDKAGGFILGDFSCCAPDPKKQSLRIAQVLDETFSGLTYPVLSGVRYGHIKKSIAFPIGSYVRVNGNINTVEFLETGVT